MKQFFLLAITLFVLSFTQNTNAQGMVDSESFGAGVQYNSLFYGLSAKYNFTEVHSGELVVGGGNYGFAGSFNSFTITGRYLYNFKVEDNYRIYGFGQLGYWTLKYDYSAFGVNYDDSYNSISYGAGAGIEYAFDGLEQLGFNAEIGYGGGSFEDGLGYSGIIFGVGAHYYFSF